MSIENLKATNLFRFAIYQGDRVLCEVVDSADKYYPAIRYSVKIRNETYTIMNRLNRLLSMKNYSMNYSLGKNAKVLNFKKEALSEINKYPESFQGEIISYLNPKTKTNPYNLDNVGVECKFGLYINNNTIVERDFYVENYNPDVAYSLDIIEVCEEILSSITDRLRKEDINFQWENKDLNERCNLNYTQIYELTQDQRHSYLKQLYK